MLTTLLSFVFVLGILIFVHELGHFLVAKKVGIRVEKFSLGFPPSIFSKTVGETTYCIGLIPLGGYVKMVGENPDEESTGAPYEFMSKTVGQRFAVIFAGPFMNYLLSIVLLIGIFLFTGQPIFDEERIMVAEIQEGKPAALAGIKNGDHIISIDGMPVSHYDTLRLRIYAHKSDPVDLSWVSGTDTLSAMITPYLEMIPNADGGVDTVGMIGFSQMVKEYQRYGFLESIENGFVTAHVIVFETVRFLKKWVMGEIPRNMIGGPIFIAQQSGKEARKGASSLFFFMALLSVNLAVLNILPIPILDGGHLVFLLVEKIKGSPLSMNARVWAQQVGLILLLLMIVLVTYNDIVRAFRGY